MCCGRNSIFVAPTEVNGFGMFPPHVHSLGQHCKILEVTPEQLPDEFVGKCDATLYHQLVNVEEAVALNDPDVRFPGDLILHHQLANLFVTPGIRVQYVDAQDLFVRWLIQPSLLLLFSAGPHCRCWCCLTSAGRHKGTFVAGCAAHHWSAGNA